MTMQTDDMDKLLYEKIGACRDRWLESQPEQCESHDFSEAFKVRLSEIGKHNRRSPWIESCISGLWDTVLGTLAAIIGVKHLSPIKTFQGSVVNGFNPGFPKSMNRIQTSDTDCESEIKLPVLGWLPEGMVEIRREEDEISSMLYYDDFNGKRLILYIGPKTEGRGNTSSLDTENTDAQEIYINGKSSALVVERDHSRLVFFVENYCCSLSGTLTVDEIVKIAENIILK